MKRQGMHDLHCKDASDMNSKVLAERVRELKETQKGVEFMCREMEQIYSEGMENGIVLESDRNSHPKTSRINQSESDRNSQS